MTQVKYGKKRGSLQTGKVAERKPRLDEEDEDDEKSGQRDSMPVEESSSSLAPAPAPASGDKPRLSISSLERGADSGEKLSSRKSITSRSTGGKSPTGDSTGPGSPMLSSDKSLEVDSSGASVKRKVSAASPSVSTGPLKGYELIDYDNIATRTGAVSISMHSPEDAAEDSKCSGGGSGGGGSETSKVSDIGAVSAKTLPVSTSSGKMMIDAYGRLIRVEGGPSSVTSSSSTSSTGSMFSLSSLTKESAEEKERKKIRLENDRLAKWTKMLKDWDDKFVVDMEKNDLLKKRVRKGIPDAVRGVVYSKILGTDSIRKGKESAFADLCAVEHGEFDEIIRRDIHRTNPTHVMFMQKDGMGQEALYRVLRAYSLYDKEVGYCQGMGSFVSVMLTYTTEDESFWLLIGLLQGKHPIRDTYFPNLLGLRRSFYIFEKCLQKFLPSLSKHLQNETFSAPIYSSRWFGTLCADFPIETTLRIWDVLIFEGPKILYRVGLAVMKLAQKRLKAKKFEDLVDILRDVQQTIDADVLLETAFSFNLKRTDIDKWSEKFNAREKESPGTI